MSYPEPTPHSAPERIGDDLFVVYGCVRTNAFVRFTRNMVVVRHGGELTLINPVRMADRGLKELEALGTVGHVLRLGPFHGMDDPFYVDRYGASFWSLPGGTTYTTPPIDHELSEAGELPFPSARLFVFSHMKEPEGAILLERTPGVLLTVDSIQSYATPPHAPHTNLLTRLLMPRAGFPRETIIGPVWMKIAVTDREGMRREFERLLELDFDQLLSAHGTFLRSGAKAEVRRAFAKQFAG